MPKCWFTTITLNSQVRQSWLILEPCGFSMQISVVRNWKMHIESVRTKKALKTHNAPRCLSRCQSSRKSIAHCSDGKKQPHFDSFCPASPNLPPHFPIPLPFCPCCLSFLYVCMQFVWLKVQLLCFFSDDHLLCQCPNNTSGSACQKMTCFP